MNKHLKFLMIAAVAVITISSCKKDKTDDTTTDGSCKISNIKNYEDNQLQSSIDLSYDGMGRLIKISEGNDYRSTFGYTTNKITITDDDGEKTELTLENGRVIKAMEEGSDSYQTYSYNTEGYLITVKRYYLTQIQTTDEITYSGGNISKVTVTEIGQGTTVIDYEYTTDLAPSGLFVASPLFDIVDYYIPGNHFGKESKNLQLKTTNTYSSTNSSSKDVSTFTYVKDAKGNYTTMTINSVETNSNNGGQTNTYTEVEKYDLTYVCN